MNTLYHTDPKLENKERNGAKQLITNKEQLKTLLYRYEDKKSFARVAELMNDSVEELVKEYLI